MGRSHVVEAVDQTFLVTSDDVRLDIVSGNTGMRRPIAGLSDSHWRAMVAAVSLADKVDLQAFVRLIQICLGPQYGRPVNLTTASAIDDNQVTVSDPTNLVQVGTLVFDPGLATEETIRFDYRDPATGVVDLRSRLRYPHRVIASVENWITDDLAIGAVTIPVVWADDFPVGASLPFPLLVGRNTLREEVAVVTAVNAGPSTLTCLPLTKEHLGPRSQFVSLVLTVAAPAGRQLLRFGALNTRNISNTGWLRLNKGGGSEEVVQYDGNDATTGDVSLVRPLANAHAANERVDYITMGEEVATAGIIQEGRHWDAWQPGPRRLVVYIPEDIMPMRLVDASYLHDSVPNVVSTTLASAYTADDAALVVGSVAGFPQPGTVLIDGSTYARYHNASFGGTAGSGSTTTIVAWGGVALAPSVYIGQFLTWNGATRTITANTADTVTVSVAFAAAPEEGDALTIGDGGTTKLMLVDALGVSFAAGTSVALVTFPYAGTRLEDGNIRDASGDVQLHRYTGPYVYAPGEYAPSENASTLAQVIAFPTTVAAAVEETRTCIEVMDASTWSAVENVRLGRLAGTQEDREIVNVVTHIGVATTITGAHVIGQTTLTVGATAAFPNGTAPCGYRILLNSAEYVRVSDIGSGTTFLLEAPGLTANYAGGEDVELVADVLVLSTAMGNDHAIGERAEPLYESMQVVNGALFGDAGDALLNFGWEKPAALRKIATGTKFGPPYTIELAVPPLQVTALNAAVAFGAVSFTVDNSYFWPWGGDGIHALGYELVIDPGGATEEIVTVKANNPATGAISLVTGCAFAHVDNTVVQLCYRDFPAANYPYQILANYGSGLQFAAQVTDYDAATNILTLNAIPTHVSTGRHAAFIGGTPEVVAFTSRDGPVLTFAEPTLFESGHHVGETVELTPTDNNEPPRDGSGDAFYLPPDPGFCLLEMFDLVRAAGVRVEIVNQR